MREGQKRDEVCEEFGENRRDNEGEKGGEVGVVKKSFGRVLWGGSTFLRLCQHD